MKKLKHSSLPQSVFLEGLELYESEKNVFTRHNEPKMLKTLMQLSMANPRRVALETDAEDQAAMDKINKIQSLLTGLTLAVNDIKKFH